MSAVTEDGSGIHLRQAPRKRASREIKGFTKLARVARPATCSIARDHTYFHSVNDVRERVSSLRPLGY